MISGCYLACKVQDLGVHYPCHRGQRAHGHRLPILLPHLGACPRLRCHCPQPMLELLALPKQGQTWAEHLESPPNLEKKKKTN